MSGEGCPCGSGKGFDLCCEPYLAGKALPETAEALMRSRYSAYFYALGQYIHDTHHQDYRGNTSPEEFTQSAESTQWCHLEVVQSSQQDSSGVVEFKASFIDKDID